MTNDFHELTFYTLAHPDQLYFIHQHAVDAYQAQNASVETRPITLIFSLIGLCLYVEMNYTGRQVQQAHMKLSRSKRPWPDIQLPEFRGEIAVSDVLKADPGEARDLMIKDWCVCVWNAYESSHGIVAELIDEALL